MSYDDIRDTIENCYNNLEQIRRWDKLRGSKARTKSFYADFSRAIDELHTCVSPFVTTTAQFIQQVKYKKDKVNRDVYRHMVDYCRDKLGVDIN